MENNNDKVENTEQEPLQDYQKEPKSEYVNEPVIKESYNIPKYEAPQTKQEKKSESRINGTLIFAHITNLAALALVILYFLNIIRNLQLIEYFILGLLAFSSLLGLIGEFRRRKISSFFFLVNCSTLTCLIVLKAFFSK